ncbi:MAG: permease-like cell division protein FtsX [Paludibacteraceae bacterium]|nr:permease-like cell division protein FtsX [Paludibacteraceae bacterium]
MSSLLSKGRTKQFFNMRFTATITIVLVLFVVGLIACLFLVAKNFSQQTKENFTVSIVIKENSDSTEVVRLGEYLSKVDFVSKAVYISKEQALEDHIVALGENPAEFLGFNPLLASYEVNLKSTFVNAESLKDIEQRIISFSPVQEVVYQKDMIDLLNRNLQKLGVVLLGICAIMLFISLVLTNNTIRLLLYSKRFVINTMRLVGAKASFIRRPFVWQSIKMGIWAILLALICLGGVLYYLQKELGLVMNLLTLDFVIPIVAIVTLFGILITWISAVFAVNKYIRLGTNKLYYI